MESNLWSCSLAFSSVIGKHTTLKEFLPTKHHSNWIEGQWMVKRYHVWENIISITIFCMTLENMKEMTNMKETGQGSSCMITFKRTQGYKFGKRRWAQTFRLLEHVLGFRILPIFPKLGNSPAMILMQLECEGMKQFTQYYNCLADEFGKNIRKQTATLCSR